MLIIKLLKNNRIRKIKFIVRFNQKQTKTKKLLGV